MSQYSTGETRERGKDGGKECDDREGKKYYNLVKGKWSSLIWRSEKSVQAGEKGKDYFETAKGKAMYIFNTREQSI